VDSAIAASEAQTAITAHAGGFPNFPSRKNQHKNSEQHREQPEAKGNPLQAKILSENKSDAETPECGTQNVRNIYQAHFAARLLFRQNRQLANDRKHRTDKSGSKKKNGALAR